MKETFVNDIKLSWHCFKTGHRRANIHTIKKGQDLCKMADAGVNMGAFVYGGGLEDSIGCFNCDYGK